MRFRAVLEQQLRDREIEEVRANHAAALRELQAFVGARASVIIEGVQLANGVATPIAHRLGRAPRMVITSPPRGAVATGRITEIRDGEHDRARFVVLQADGFGGTVSVDVEVK